MEQNRRPNISTHNYRHMIFDKVGGGYTLEKRQHLQQLMMEKLGCPHVEE